MGKGHIAMLAANRGREAKMEIMLRNPRPQTWSARMPAYCYTELCPVRRLRRYPAGVERQRGGGAGGERKATEP